MPQFTDSLLASYSVMNTFVALPSSVAYNPSVWNATTHGNITFTIFLFLTR